MTPPRSHADDPPRKPLDEEIDVFGITHQGKVRQTNQDHFLICSLSKKMDVLRSSLDHATELFRPEAERLAFLALVADGVGGSAAGEEASRLAVEAVTRYVSESIDVYYTSDPTDDRAFVRSLTDAVHRSHADLTRARERAGIKSMATTLTLFIGVWPKAYLLQVGDSRYYVLRGDELTQVTRDQTLAQELVDQRVMSKDQVAGLPWADVLSSSLGGAETVPAVTSLDQDWNYVHLLCTDGLTKHVSDGRIRERLMHMTSAEQVCRELLQDALDGGGTDNITLIVERDVPGGVQARGA